MILDTTESIKEYFGIHPRMKEALEFLVYAMSSDLSDGKYEIDGSSVYASISNEMGKGVHQTCLEAHKKYIDIQICLEGVDHIGWKPVGEIQKSGDEYNSEKDVMFFSDESKEYFTVSGNTFCIFFPHDAHAPLSGNTTLRKMVIKIEV